MRRTSTSYEKKPVSIKDRFKDNRHKYKREDESNKSDTNVRCNDIFDEDTAPSDRH